MYKRQNSDNGLHDGLVPDMLREIQEFTGLKFTYLYADSYKDAIELVRTGKADMLGVFLGSEEDSAQKGLALTAPYTSLNDIGMRNKMCIRDSHMIIDRLEQILFGENPCDNQGQD